MAGSGGEAVRRDRNEVVILKIVGRLSKFFREVMAEMKKVAWPTRRETAIYTGVVVATVTVVAVAIWVFDSILGYLLGLLVRY